MSAEIIIPAFYKNLQKKLEGSDIKMIIEAPLYTDACGVTFDFNIESNPYKVINPAVISRDNIVLPRLILRLEEYRKIEPEDKDDTRVSLEETPMDFYLENNIADQVAVLISLILGIRLKAGNINRIFKPNELFGQPVSHYINSDPPPIRLAGMHPVLPGALKNIYKEPIEFSLLDIESYFVSFIKFKPEQAELLIRAAKLYRDALWLIESEPQLSWIMLVSAIEVIASENIKSTKSSVEIFKEKESELAAEILLSADEELLRKIAEKFVDTKWIGAKYREFLIKYLPDPPQIRPTPDMRIKWDDLKIKSNKNLLSVIYQYRSRALHKGTPFPLDMCYIPRLPGIHYEFAEKRSSTFFALKEGKPIKVKVGPMLISIFEYIVRHALLKWWTETAGVSGPLFFRVILYELPPSFMIFTSF